MLNSVQFVGQNDSVQSVGQMNSVQFVGQHDSVQSVGQNRDPLKEVLKGESKVVILTSKSQKLSFSKRNTDTFTTTVSRVRSLLQRYDYYSRCQSEKPIPGMPFSLLKFLTIAQRTIDFLQDQKELTHRVIQREKILKKRGRKLRRKLREVELFMNEIEKKIIAQSNDIEEPQLDTEQVSIPPTVGFDLDDITSKLFDVQHAAVQMNIPAVFALIGSFLSTNNTSKKIALVYAMITLFWKEIPLEQVMRLRGCVDELGETFKLIQNVGVQHTAHEIGMYVSEFFSGVNEMPEELQHVHFQAVEGVNTIFDTAPTEASKSWLRDNAQMCKAIVGILAMLSVLFGANQLFNMELITCSTKKLKDMASTITSTRIIKGAVSEATDSIMEIIYGIFGEAYTPPGEEHLRQISDELAKFTDKLNTTIARIELDYFGMRNVPIDKLLKEYNVLARQINHLTVDKANLYNISTRSSQAFAKLENLRQKIVESLRSSGSKQRPVTIWVAGAANTGKSHLTRLISENFARKWNTTIYSRNVLEEHWNGYNGQGVILMDDVMQRDNAQDLVDLHAYTTIDAKSVNAASLDDKGTPFRSRLICMSSNYMWIAPPCELTDMLAMNRRRDICIYAYNPAVVQYMTDHHGCAPEGDEFFIRNPTRWFLYNPTYGFTGNIQQVRNRKFTTDGKYVVSEVTMEQIVEAVDNLEIKRAEEFRKTLVRDKINEIFPVPDVPFEFDASKLFYSNTPSAISVNSGGSQVTDLTDISNQSIQGATVAYTTERRAILVMGDAGVGKTRLIEECVPDLQTYNWSAPQTSGAILMDDIANNVDRINQFKCILDDYYRGRSNFSLLVATCNNDTGVWQELDAQSKDMIMRRCMYVTITYTTIFRISCTWKGLSCADAIKDLTGEERAANLHFAFIRECSHYAGFAGIRSLLTCTQDTSNTRVIEGDFTLPPSNEREIIVKIDLTVDEIQGRKPMDVVRMCTAVRKREDGRYTRMSMFEGLPIATSMSGIFQILMGIWLTDRHQLVPLLNAQKLADTGLPHMSIGLNDYEIGLVPIEGTLTFYRIDNALDLSAAVIRGSVIEHNGETYVYDHEQQKRYRTIVTSMIEEKHKSRSLPSEAITAKDEIKKRFTSLGPSKFIRFAAITLSALFMSGMLYAMVRPDDKEETVYITEERKRNVKTTSVQVDDSSASKSRPANRPVYHETKFQPKMMDLPTVDEDIPIGTCVLERKKVAKKSVDVDVGGSSAGKNRHPKTVLERKKPKKSGQEVEIGESGSAKSRSSPTRLVLETNQPQVVQHFDGSFGLLINDCVHYLYESSRGAWIYMESNQIELWKAVQNDYPLVKVDRAALKGSINKIFVTSAKHVDYGSIFAFMHASRIGLDLERDFIDDINAKILFSTLPAPAGMPDFDKRKSIEPEGMADAGIEMVVDKIHCNAGSIQVDGLHNLHGIWLNNKYGITNAHAPEEFNFVFDTKEDSVRCKLVFKSKANDVALFRPVDMKVLSGVRDLTSVIMKERDLLDYCSKTRSKVPTVLAVFKGKSTYMTFTMSETHIATMAHVDSSGMVTYKGQLGSFGNTGITKAGDCGSPILMVNPRIGQKWYGIHRAGAIDVSVSAPITAEYIQKLIQTVECANESGASILTAEAARKVENDMRPHDEIEYISPQMTESGLYIIGKAKRHVSIPDKTRKYETGLGLTKDFEPAILHCDDIRMSARRDLLREAIGRYNDRHPVGDIEEEVRLAANRLGQYLADYMSHKGMTTRVITRTEAINTPPKEEYPTANAIDRTGSAGYPWNAKYPGKSTKNDFLEQSDDSNWRFKKDAPSQEIASKLTLMIEDAKRGISDDIAWIAYLKDEVLKTKKTRGDNIKTRTFFSGPFEYLLAYRQYFGAAIWRLGEIFDTIPIKVGISGNSLQWHTLANYHLRVDSEGFASDMQNWDGSVPIEFIKAMPIIYNAIYRATNIDNTPMDDKVREVLHKQVEGSKVIVRDDVYQLTQAMVSGCPGTAVENSMINWLLFYLCYNRLANLNQPEQSGFVNFTENVALSVYGDDNICTIKRDIQNWFNFYSFKDTAGEFGFIVTDAGKTGDIIPPIIPLVEMEFLKRNFVKQGFLFTGPLMMTSIRKAFTWLQYEKPYAFIGTWLQYPDTGALNDFFKGHWKELALHGKQIFEAEAENIREVCRSKQIPLTIPSFEEARLQLDMWRY
uniref:Non-structural polyprotein n=1 Tax=PNG bee virus 1 TaxID=2746864 RepID=A0A7D5BRK2_9CALI|nr:non-structural polyprotein [PNG bee virus 1]